MDLKGRASKATVSLPLTAEESLEELAELTASAGGRVLDRVVQTRSAPEAATLVGSGLVERLAAQAKAENADLAIFDHDLTPTQQRNLERALDVRVLDRTQLILDIFARRARTREGRLQVELAQLNYLLPRLAGRGKEMSRLGGGIGTRGPGETQLETDRRRIARRIRKIREDLEAVRGARSVHRKQRHAVPLATLALVGYTNAGKSTLFNRLTRAGVLADDRMFATLDPTVRAVTLPSRRRVLLSDTVGFIRNLPTTLVEAFRATLEEVTEATLILHVVDASSPHNSAHVEQVTKVLAEIGASEIPQLVVLNKMDRPESRLNATSTPGRSVSVSALTGDGIDRMLSVIDEVLPFDPVVRTVFRFPTHGGPELDLLHRFGRVLETRYTSETCEVEAEVPESVRRRLSLWVIS